MLCGRREIRSVRTSSWVRPPLGWSMCNFRNVRLGAASGCTCPISLHPPIGCWSYVKQGKQIAFAFYWSLTPSPGSHISTSFFGKLPTIKSNFPFCQSCLIKNEKQTSREKHQDVLSRFISSSLEMTVEGMLSLSLSTLHRFLHHHQHHLHHRAQKEKWRGQHPVPISLAIVHHHNQFL